MSLQSEDTEEQDKEVDLDAILESAELREDEEAPQSEAIKKLLSAFKYTSQCTLSECLLADPRKCDPLQTIQVIIIIL